MTYGNGNYYGDPNPYQAYQQPYYPAQPLVNPMQQPTQQIAMQPQQQKQPLPQAQQQGQNADDRIWVSSESAADAYLMSPNSFVRLWDSNKPVFYEKSTDPQGRPCPLQIYDYKLRIAANNPAFQEAKPDLSQAFEARIQALEEKIRELEANKKKGKEEPKEA